MRPIQIVITRLLHVTMTTLHQYLGLSRELTKPVLASSLFLLEFPHNGVYCAKKDGAISLGNDGTAPDYPSLSLAHLLLTCESEEFGTLRSVNLSATSRQPGRIELSCKTCKQEYD